MNALLSHVEEFCRHGETGEEAMDVLKDILHTIYNLSKLDSMNI